MRKRKFDPVMGEGCPFLNFLSFYREVSLLHCVCNVELTDGVQQQVVYRRVFKICIQSICLCCYNCILPIDKFVVG